MVKKSLVTAEELDVKIKDVFSVSNGYFGRVNTYGQTKNEFEFLGLYCKTSYLPWLESLNNEQRRELLRITSYFEIHMRPLKKLLYIDEKDYIDRFSSEMAWSHFATTIFFGILEVAIKLRDKNMAIDDYLRYKLKNILAFLNQNLSQQEKDSVVSRYKYKSRDNTKHNGTFNAVVKDMWDEVRSGFTHDAGFERAGLENAFFVDAGVKKDGIPVLTISEDVSIQDWLQITWQSIFNAYGFGDDLIAVTSDNIKTIKARQTNV